VRRSRFPPRPNALRKICGEYDNRFSDDPAATLSVAWGYVDGADPFSGRVVLSFYPQSMAADVMHGVQEVSGVKLIYFTTEKFHPLFDGKVIDHSAERGFFLRAP
jgi:hypothetical protein